MLSSPYAQGFTRKNPQGMVVYALRRLAKPWRIAHAHRSPLPQGGALSALLGALTVLLVACTSIQTESTALKYTDAQGVPRECKVEQVTKSETETDPEQIEALAAIIRSQIAAVATGGLVGAQPQGFAGQPPGAMRQAEPLPGWCRPEGESGEYLCLWNLDDGSCRALIVR